MSELGDFLAVASADRGGWNCSTLPADWCMARGHPDFAARWRHLVDDAECEAVSRDAGGLLALWHDGIGEGLPLAAPPYQPGDIGVIHLHGLEAGAIFTGERWAMKYRRGVVFARVPHEAVLEAWRVPHG